MTDQKGNQSVQKSASQIIATFNAFFSSVPPNKSFDMSYKAYLQELADVDDRVPLGSRLSASQLQPITLAKHGKIAPISSRTNLYGANNSLPPSAKSSSTDLSNSSDTSTTNWDATMSLADRIYADNMARKDRSMVNLLEFNRAHGIATPAQPRAVSPCQSTVYENLPRSRSMASLHSHAPSTFTENSHEYGTVINSKTCKDEVELYIKVTDCFD
ncbi:unnamed protein product [Caenorhabditis sp. 36 PRJEB53466]|nr:unnamed protein product [Caenorhabditis sp. 36 PRJEB53466]